MKRVKAEHPQARAGLREAAFWYDDERAGLGTDFYDAVDEAIAYIRDCPEAAPVFPGWDEEPTIRSKRVRTFPYRVIYYVTGTTIMIVAYSHNRRRPGYWQHRLTH